MDEPAILSRVADYPELVALGILVAGFVVARLAGLIVARLLAALDRRLSRLSTDESGTLSPHLITFSRGFVFWIVLVIAVAIALRILVSSDAGDDINTMIIAFIPNALIAFAIIVGGYVFGWVSRNLAASIGDQTLADSPGPRLLHGVIVGVAVVMALQHLGINLTLFTRLLLVLVAVGSGGLMLAFAMGARNHVANLLAHRELRRYAVGENIRIGDVQGAIVEFHSTAVDVMTSDGIVAVPAARFAQENVLRLRDGQQDV